MRRALEEEASWLGEEGMAGYTHTGIYGGCSTHGNIKQQMVSGAVTDRPWQGHV